jgi:hypothetical protein
MGADPIDNASDTEELFRYAAIQNARRCKPIEAATECLNCEEPINQLPDPTQPPRRWCCVSCRDEWQRRQH